MESLVKTVGVVYFSPTDTSKKVALALAEGTGAKEIKEFDLTTDESVSPIVCDADLLVLAAPVYAGRVTLQAIQRFQRIQASGVPALVAVVYGNRDYEDALIELRDEAEKLHLKVIAAGAFIGEHSFSRKQMPVAEGRPDASDLQKARELGQKAVLKLAQGVSEETLCVKGNVPYRAVKEQPPVAPVCLEGCTLCGKCIVVCPVHAISKSSEGKIETDAEKCTLCCACVKKCPFEQRVFDTPFTKFLYDNFRERREPELFL